MENYCRLFILLEIHLFLGCSLVISNLDLLISTRLGVIGNFYFIQCFYMLELSWIFPKCKVIIV